MIRFTKKKTYIKNFAYVDSLCLFAYICGWSFNRQQYVVESTFVIYFFSIKPFNTLDKSIKQRTILRKTCLKLGSAINPAR